VPSSSHYSEVEWPRGQARGSSTYPHEFYMERSKRLHLPTRLFYCAPEETWILPSVGLSAEGGVYQAQRHMYCDTTISIVRPTR
jgi:hypothetical protein